MKKVFVIVSVAFLLLVFGTLTNSYAIPISMEFSASGFVDWDGNEAPDDPVSGTITWEAASVNATIDYLISVDLTIGGHNYLLSEIDYESPSPYDEDEDLIGGVAEGIEYIMPGTNDFWLRWNRETLEVTDFSYSVYASSVELSDFWYATSYEASISAETAPVPEPSSIVLMGLGLVGLAGYGRKRMNR